jgi:hypothetical protein
MDMGDWVSNGWVYSGPVSKTEEELRERWMRWCGDFATQLKDDGRVDTDRFFTMINEDLDQQGESDMQDFLLACFKQGEEPKHCANRVSGGIVRPLPAVDGQVREKGIGNA